MSRDAQLNRDVVNAKLNQYCGLLPFDTCPKCNGVLGVDTSRSDSVRGGWRVRHVICRACRTRYGKWSVPLPVDPMP